MMKARTFAENIKNASGKHHQKGERYPTENGKISTDEGGGTPPQWERGHHQKGGTHHQKRVKASLKCGMTTRRGKCKNWSVINSKFHMKPFIFHQSV
jgi:hypothetical protein